MLKVRYLFSLFCYPDAQYYNLCKFSIEIGINSKSSAFTHFFLNIEKNNLHFVYQYDLIWGPRTLDNNCFEISLIQIDIQLMSCRVIELNRTYLFLANKNDTYIVYAGLIDNQQPPKPLQKK